MRQEVFSPFIFGNTVSTKSFTNREEEALKLSRNLLGGTNTIIISPRRWGKSSLVEKVILDIQKTETLHKTVVIDLFTISNETEFFEVFTREIIKATSTKWQDWMDDVKQFLHHLVPSVQIGVKPNIDLTIKYDWEKIVQHTDELLDLPERIAKAKGIRLIICLDEFQNLTSFPEFERFEKKMRAIWQRQKHVTYCLYGSKRHMLSDIFNNKSKPFYRFGDLFLLPKIKEEKWVSFIQESFKETGKRIEPVIARVIPMIMHNHSWYVQQLSHYVWNTTDKVARFDQLAHALDELIYANQPLYQREIEGLSTTQVNLLKAVTMREKQLTSTRVMQRYNIGTPRNVSKNKEILAGNDMIHKTEDGLYEFLDPAFELWFRKQYFKIPWIISEETIDDSDQGVAEKRTKPK